MAPSVFMVGAACFASVVFCDQPIARDCPADSEKFWALDKPNNECAETCLCTEVQKTEFKIITGFQGQAAGNESSPCAVHSYHTYNRTDILGTGPLKIALDKYLPDQKMLAKSPAKDDKCALDCTIESIGVYWACAAVCIKTSAPDSCITAGCLAAVTAYDVKCLKGCHNSSNPGISTDFLI
eukprot:TRINITY_DN62172_c0_g1_i1.p1 TRINITY_DN62172_c0_g1~~TRINITY_DN62172_c0_g1_i1.p1  ORF type:complete len:182 (+),score=28.60 TRINITY_DN62172_c0_g1_i1:117-662(+)